MGPRGDSGLRGARCLFFFQAEDGIRDYKVTGVQTCALPICANITKAIQDFQSKVVDLQWRMQEQSQRLASLLEKPAVDQVAALAQVDEVLGEIGRASCRERV